MITLETIETLFRHIGLEAPIRFERLGGLTNRNYRVETEKSAYAVRFAGNGTDNIIDRRDEHEIMNVIKKLNIDTKMIAFDIETGTKVSEFIDSATFLTYKDFSDMQRIKRVAEMMNTYHHSDTVEICFDVFDMVSHYEKAIIRFDGYFPRSYILIKHLIFELYKKYAYANEIKVLCHNDPIPENFILDKYSQRLYLIGWDYGGMNSPFWDLAGFSLEANLTHEQDEHLLKSYFKDSLTELMWAEFEAYKLFVDLLWSLWGIIRHELREEEDGDKYHNYGQQRFERLISNLDFFIQRYEMNRPSHGVDNDSVLG